LNKSLYHIPARFTALCSLCDGRHTSVPRPPYTLYADCDTARMAAVVQRVPQSPHTEQIKKKAKAL